MKKKEQKKTVKQTTSKVSSKEPLDINGNPIDPKNWLYGNIATIMDKPGRMLEVLDVLAQQVGVRGIFSDWPGTITYYNNCTNDLSSPFNK